jgi:hypothetical protein
MEDLKKLEIKTGRKLLRTEELDEAGWEGENPQRVVVPNGDDDSHSS